MYINAIARFGVKDVSAIDKMSLEEYFLRSEAYQVEQVDDKERIAIQAWLNQAVQATKGSSKHPKPYFNKFSDFYNSTQYINEIHKSYNSEYVAQTTSEQEKETAKQDEIMNRTMEYNKKKQAEKER
jgi:hypothetical protein